MITTAKHSASFTAHAVTTQVIIRIQCRVLATHAYIHTLTGVYFDIKKERKKERKKEEKNKVAQNLLDDLGLRGRIQL